jgi:superfamily II DNA/RNA helicase
MAGGRIGETGETNETGENTLFVEKQLKKKILTGLTRLTGLPLFSLSLQEADFEAGN